MKRAWAGIVLTTILAACSVDIPSDVISQRRMEQILYDYHRAQGMADVDFTNAQEERYKMAQLVFQKYGITEAEFDSSMLWYSSHSHHLAEIYTHIEERLSREAEKIGVETVISSLYDKYTDQGDTALIWRRKIVALTAEAGRNMQIFSLPADSNFLRGDAFQLHFSTRFVSQNYQNEGHVMFTARYDNDSVQAMTMRLTSDIDTRLNLSAEDLACDHDLKSLSVAFYLDPSDDVYHLWLLRNLFVLRIHRPELMHQRDSLAADTLQADTLLADSLLADTLPLNAEPQPAAEPALRSQPTAPARPTSVPSTPIRPVQPSKTPLKPIPRRHQ